MSGDEVRGVQDTDVEKDRARYGLLAVVISNLAIAGVAIFGVWQLDGDKSVIVGVLTAAFTAVSSMTTAYLGIKAVSNTAKSIAMGHGPARQPQHGTPPAQTPRSQTPPAQTPPAQRSTP
ncbi:hypothetical protein [Streptomyces sp. NK08204]|uniref:hypothetical protein n=1 Tax=Streptomyces sp. NK08204 TaxID=2873260 RepID=UPI001CEE0584|nr:hypothetical protein [Streptomyces sp. NK08204]